ncbi:hypothetical protein PRK78_003990 [Emydomyces testavorans]|uniref:Bromo domain-containing protein n=1 Tax=Emydomyces testavorans TaxID=2070801 RepID=A0AAF0DJ36_9EURO|nr:hypothetical protein PRK78_003990 [Emydomyces testavorans]
MPPKRRASEVVPQDTPERFPKRQRFSTFIPVTDETPEETTKAGLDLLDKIKVARDKHQNFIAPEFLHLPDRVCLPVQIYPVTYQSFNEFPEYFESIRLPIALDMIETRLRNHEYPCLTLLEADLRRMVSNAKSYNPKGSALFSNAERIRKIIVAVMAEINPAYKDENYVPFSAPVPDDDKERGSAARLLARSRSRTGNGEPAPRRNTQRRQHRTPTTDRDVEPIQSSGQGFEGYTFERAQEKIISDMIRLKDEDGEELFFPFLSKPDRTLYKEYYDIIKHPTSLRAILKLVRGTDGRKNSTKMSPFKTWDAFAEEVSYIWRNAKEFNEDGSAIVQLAEDLMHYFYERLEQARKAVPEPTAAGDGGPTRIKLRVGSTKTPEPSPQKLMLKFSGRQGESTAEKPHLGVTVDSESLRRQQELVRAGSGGGETSAQPSVPTRTLRDRAASSARTHIPSQDSAFGPPTPGKVEFHPSQSPKGVGASIAQHNEGPRKLNGLSAATVAPSQPLNGPSSGGVTAPGGTLVNTRKPLTPDQTAVGSASVSATWPPRKYVVPRSRLIAHVNLRTENGPKFNLDIPPSSIIPQQSVTLSVPFSHNILYLRPTVVSSNLERQTQLTVTVGSQKIPSLGPPVRSADFTIPRYELRLGPGVTKVDVEMYAAPGRGLVNLAAPNGPGVEYEAFTLYIHVMHR